MVDMYRINYLDYVVDILEIISIVKEMVYDVNVVVFIVLKEETFDEVLHNLFVVYKQGAEDVNDLNYISYLIYGSVYNVANNYEKN